jgi:hypothetical protein
LVGQMQQSDLSGFDLVVRKRQKVHLLCSAVDLCQTLRDAKKCIQN